jgi:hypothetical protein
MNNKLFDKYFSKESAFRPISGIPLDDWENKNRRLWSQSELDALWQREVGEFEFNVKGCDLFIKPIDRNEAARLYHYEKKEPGKLFCGQVLKIGRLAFDLACFPTGASATYGDYVMFSIQDCEPCDLGPYRYFIVNDLDILGVVNDPHSLIKKHH